MLTEVKIGCDPEGFLHLNNRYVNAAGLFPGTKKEPFELDKGAVQVDGTALEFNIHPAETAEEFEKNIATVIIQLNEMIQKVDKDMKLVFRPVANFEKEDWDTFSNDSKVLGCDPDYNYLGNVNPNPAEQLANVPIRTAAGHVHIGWDEGKGKGDPSHFADCLHVAKAFHSKRVFAPVIADESKRLQYYGNYGAWRPKSYGVEIRSPSNIWVGTTAGRIDTFNKARKTFRDCTGL